ncbi:MAG: hypothetical protein PSV22_13375 [Pseudolabrys sp.]|nr:hypothetical protein [Pseudolabrys sp.]
MAEYLSQHASQIWSFLAGIVGGGLGGSLLTVHFTRNRVSGRGTVTDQSKSVAGGDIVGRDKVLGQKH